MKTSLDPRHKKRQKIVKLLFAESFLKQSKSSKIGEILKNLTKIDKAISKIAPSFPIEKINKIDLAILRLAVFEILIEKKQPPKVVVDEAIELAKELPGEKKPAFINGALGKLLDKK